jgi:hypothetical protein
MIHAFCRLIGLFVSAALTSIISSTSASISLESFTSIMSAFKSIFFVMFVHAMRVHFSWSAFIIFY